MPFNLFKRHKVEITKEEYLARLLAKGLNPDGTPILDPTPIAPPIGYKKQPSMVEIVRDMVRSEKLKAEAEAAGFESFEEADDFDIPDDPVQLRSPWENDFDPSVEELMSAGREALAKRSPPDSPPSPQATPPVPPPDGPPPGDNKKP